MAIFALSCDDDPSAPPPGDIPDRTDRTPPEAVADLSVSFTAFEGARLAWTAPRDDGEHNQVASYQIRYSDTFPMDWWTAEPVTDPPSPLVEGSPQEHVITNVARGSDFYVAIRCVDAAGLVSPVSSIAHARVPGYSFDAVSVDAMSSTPVAGLDVHVVEQFTHDFVTGLDGRFEITDVARTAVDVRIASGAATSNYHGFHDAFLLDADRSLTYPMIEYRPSIGASYDNVLEILVDAVIGSDPILKKWPSLPVAWYAPAFVNVNGIDYYDAAVRAAARWNEATGLPLFVAVATPPAIGITIEYLPPAMMGGQNGITSHTNDAQGYPLLDNIRIVDGFSDGQRLYSIMMHELGHTIRLHHLNDSGYIMFASQPLPLDISQDEIRAVQLMTALPNGTDLSDYDLSAPR